MNRKIILAVLVSIILILLITSGFFLEKISKDNVSPSSKLTEEEQRTNESVSNDDLPNGDLSKETQTIMVYMTGSNLESGNGMAVRDINEIAAAGLDTERHNVLLYIGGSSEWTNGMGEDGNTVYILSGDEFKAVQTFGMKNMCDDDTLAEFLNWSYENYKTDGYSLIMWNHGGGPNVGFGMDENFDNDCLTLIEMRKALGDSTFNENNKLEWVSFDACLMASVELAGVFAPYARYLIASQESEPGYGHNYEYLSVLNEDIISGDVVGQRAADEYMSYYNAMAAQDEEYVCDVTMSCMNLEKYKPLKKAMDRFFWDVEEGARTGDFGNIVRARAKSKEFGLYTTSNSYDLVDLYSLAEQLSEMYSSAENLKAAIRDFVIVNESNVAGANGISVYYPYDNKEYQNTWMEEYDEISASENYASLLKFMTNDVGNSVAANVDSDVPYEDVDWFFDTENLIEREEKGFAIKLTEEQRAYVSHANCIIVRDSLWDGIDERFEDCYGPCTIACNIMCDENSEFFAEIERYVVQLNDKTNGECGPVLVLSPENNRDIVKLSCLVGDMNETYESYLVDINLRYNDEKKSYDMGPMMIDKDEELSPSGYIADKQYLNPDDFDYLMIAWPVYKITYEEDGTAKPFHEWEKNGNAEGYDVDLRTDEYCFELIDIPEEDEDYYHAVFRVVDIYGNVHMSPLVELN